MPVSGSNGVKQAIAAYTYDAGPRELGTRTFTSYLAESLQKLGNGRPFNAQHLYDDIVAVQQNYEYHYPPRVKYNPAGKPTPIVPHAPFFFTLTPTKATLDLAPMPRGHPSPQAQNGANSTPKAAGHESAEGRDAPVISPAAVADMVFNEPRLLVCTTFVGDPGPDMTGFNQWIANTPSLASKVAVEGMFLGPPTVLLISIPQSLWTVIQDAKICFSLGYINSHNLINLYDGLMKASTTAPPRRNPVASARDIEDGRTLLEAREAAVNNSPTYRNDYHTSPYQQQQPPPQLQQQQSQQPQQQLPTLPPMLQHQHQQPPHQHQQQHQQAPLKFHSSPQHQSTLPPPQLPQLPPPTAHTHQPLPLPVPQRQNSQVHASSHFHELGPAGHYEPNGPIRRDSIPQLQEHPSQRFTSPPHSISLPRIVSRSGSPALPKDEREDSEEMKEAAEQLKALSHVRPANGNTPPPFTASGHLLKIAQDVIKCQTDDSTSEDTDMKDGDVSTSSPNKKSKPKKDYRFKTAKSQDGQPIRSRSKSDISAQSLPSLQPQTSKPEVQCDWCSHEPFKDHSSLRKHVASAHTRPFPCAFSFAGCTSTFGSKNEWKRHIASQHLCLQYYRCSDCSQGSVDGKGNEFNRKDLFTQHLRRMHAPPYIRKAIQKRDTKIETEWEDYVKDMQKSCCIVRRLPPQRSACPRPDCNRPFEGRTAWDEWTEHVGRHMENGEGEFLGVDDMLVSWALDEGIISRTEDNSFRLCNPMGSGTGGGNNGNGGSIGNSGGSSNINVGTNSSNNGSGNTATANSNDNGSGNGNHSTSNGHSPPNTNTDATKGNVLPQISIATVPADANDAPSQRNDKMTMPPTPPPTTTRLQPGEVETVVKEEAGEHTKNAVSEPTPTEKDGSVDVAKTPEAAAIAAADTLTAAAAIGSLSEEKKIGEPRPASEEDTQEKPVETPKTEDLSGLQSITVAAIAAAAALQQQQNEKATNGAMDVDG